MLFKQYFIKQKVMFRVCYALIPISLFSIYLFGWRALFLIAIALLFGIATEAHFTIRDGKPVTSAVLVTCLVYSLSLPPTTPFWIAAIGIMVGVTFGKMVFGGFGQNIFNPAMVGRCFIYIAFPKEMTGSWIEPMWGGYGGLLSWSSPVDAVTKATPLMELKTGIPVSTIDLFTGNTPGSMGETSVILIVIGGIFLLIKKAAPWRLALSCLMGGIFLWTILTLAGKEPATPLINTLLSGSFLFGCAFVVTEPISGAKTNPGQWIYGFLVGGLTITLREFSNFSEGFMFSVLLMNAFVPLIDYSVNQVKGLKQGEK
ncbi:RnfABCDGE type electron transport complex subunit D [Thermodesulfobacteriota bacterium]